MKYSLIITAWNEPKTVRINLENILNPDSQNLLPEMEIILVCPDFETRQSAEMVINERGFQNYQYFQDERKGKPLALNIGIQNSHGEIIIAMDGDVVIGKNSLGPLVSYLEDNKVGGVSGRPVPTDTKETMLGYWANLLTEAAHQVRLRESSKGNSYFMSGYLCAFRKFSDFILPSNILSDDAWITLDIIRRGYKVAYSPNSIIYVNFPKTLSDWFKQKRRSAGGYSQLNSFYKNKKHLPKRSLFEEIKYIFFPFTYSKNFKQFFYSLALYPVRFVLWLTIFIDKRTGKSANNDLWVRIESTKE